MVGLKILSHLDTWLRNPFIGPEPARGVAEERCTVPGCGQPSKRSLSGKLVKEALPDLKLPEEARRVHLCKDHYKDYKKRTKGERELERLSW